MPQPDQYRYPCDNCGASLQFSPGQQALVCPYCGHEQQISPGAARAPGRQDESSGHKDGPWSRDTASKGAIQWDAGHKAPELRELPLADGLRLDRNSDLSETIRTLSCPNCGAKIEVTSEKTASSCPFCATPVVTDSGSTRHIKPQALLPFALTEPQAKEALERWMKGLWFAPTGLTAYARRGRRMTGVYSPFWTFDADTHTDYHGQRGDHYYETQWVTTVVDGKRQQVARQVQKTRWTRVSGQIARHFNDVLVLASTSLPRKITDGLAPWELSQLTAYRPEYLTGFVAESYTVALADGHDIAQEEMAAVIAMDARRDIGGDVQRIDSLQTRHFDETFKHIMLPVWTAAYRYNNKSYRFVVNGQSGRVQGERPWSVWKIAFAVMLALLVVAAAGLLSEARGQDIAQASTFTMIEAGPTTAPYSDRASNGWAPDVMPAGRI